MLGSHSGVSHFREDLVWLDVLPEISLLWSIVVISVKTVVEK